MSDVMKELYEVVLQRKENSAGGFLYLLPV
jgi:hypothetical protein